MYRGSTYEVLHSVHSSSPSVVSYGETDLPIPAIADHARALFLLRCSRVCVQLNISFQIVIRGFARGLNICGVDSTAGMASEGNVPVSGVGQMNILKNKVTVAVCFVLMIILLNDGVEASAKDPKPTFMHLPLRLRNPRGVGLSHEGARISNPVPGEREPVQEDHSITFQGDDNIPKFSHLPPHMHDPRGVRVFRPMEEANAEPVSENQVESATPEEIRARFPHLLHNPRAVHVVKQIQEGISKESGRQAGDDGDKK